VALASGEAPPPPTTQDARAFAFEICSEMEARARDNGVPIHFLARLIWKESLFDPDAVSPRGAEGIAQFMPGTAKLRGLADPFEPKSAIGASAAYLADLKASVGNWGAAAAAYNAGEDRYQRWLDGETSLPLETEDYVLAITGHSTQEWKAPGADFQVAAIGKAGDFASQCVSLVMRETAPVAPPIDHGEWKPWGVTVAGGFSERGALLAYHSVSLRFASVIGEEKPLLAKKRNRSMGSRAVVHVMIGRDSRAEALALCHALTAKGGACVVERN
jgi:hypothetical protein